LKNNKDYVPSPKPSRKPKNKKKGRSHLGRENTATTGEGLGMAVDRPEATKFGMEIVNIDSSNKSKRSYADGDTVELQQTPLKKQKRATAREVAMDVE
jgi:kinesin family member 22